MAAALLPGWASLWGATAVVVTYGLLNFSQSGSSYVPGLAFLFAGLYALGTPTGGNRAGVSAVFTGLCFAGAVFVWLPFALVLPGALATVFVPRNDRRLAWRRALTAAGCAAILGAAVYLAALLGFWR